MTLLTPAVEVPPVPETARGPKIPGKGYLVEHIGTSVAFLAAGGAGLLVATAVWLLRGTVAAGIPAETRVEMDLAAR